MKTIAIFRKTPASLFRPGFAVMALAFGLPALGGQPNQTMEETMTRGHSESLVASPRISRQASQQCSVAVFYGDLNLDRPAGISALYNRLETAADEVCAPRHSGRDASLERDRKACYSDALDTAVYNVGLPGLEQAHFASTGRRAPASEQVAGR